MTARVTPLRGRDATTVQSAVDAFLSSPRCANPNTRRGYAGVLDRLLAELGADRPLATVGRDELADLLQRLWGHRPRPPGTATGPPSPAGCPGAPATDYPPRRCPPDVSAAANPSTPP